MKRYEIGMILFLVAWLTGCAGKRVEERVISVTIEPQRYFAEWIAGDKFAVNCVVPAGQSPETYDPTPEQMVRIGRSRAYLRIGPIGFEQAWMEKIHENNPGLEIFDLSEGFALAHEEAEAGEAHGHEEGGHHHHHGGADPHIWSSISGARTIARNTLRALVSIDPDNQAYYEANYGRLSEEIDRTERAVSGSLEGLKHKTFIIYHPALTYLAREYGLTQLCIELDGKEPSPAQLRDLVESARSHDAKVVFIQREFDQKNAELIARETGCRLVPINPLSADWSGEIIQIAKALADGEAD